MKGIEIGPLEGSDEQDEITPEPIPMDPEDGIEIPAPELNSPENSSDDSTDATEAGWRIKWSPQFARQA